MASYYLFDISTFKKALMQTRLGLFSLCTFISLTFVLNGCSENISHTQQQKISGSTMGTSYTVLFYYPEDKFNKFSKEMTLDIKLRIDERLNAIEQSMSTYRKDSELSLLNQFELGEWKTLNPELFKVIQTAVEVSTLSKGAFDISVGPLVNLWGFGPEYSLQNIPPAEIIASLLKDKVGYQYLTIDAEQKRVKKSKDLYLDLSAIAKGYAVDEIALLLKQQGIGSFLVEIGGELKASGEKPEGQNWKVAIEKPILDSLVTQRAIENIVTLQNMAIASSGDYRNFFEANGHIYSHTIDPSTGSPVKHGMASVTVLHESCMYADALATAFMVMGPESSLNYANEHKIPALLLIRSPKGFEEYRSNAMQAFVYESKAL